MQLPESRSDMTLIQVKVYIQTIINIYKNLEDMNDLPTLLEISKSLNTLFFNCELYRVDSAELLTNFGFPLYAEKIISYIKEHKWQTDDGWLICYYLYTILWNFSDSSQMFASAIAETNLPNILIFNITNELFVQDLMNKHVYVIIEASLNIIHNICKVPGHLYLFSDEMLKQSLVLLAKQQDEHIKCVASLSLAYLLSENETILLDTNVEAIEQIIDFVTKANKSNERRYEGYSVEEILAALSLLCVNDTIKNIIIDKNGIPLFLSILNSYNEIEVEYAIKCLWKLSFDHSIRQRLITEFHLDSILHELTKQSHCVSVKQAAEGVLWLLTEENKKVKRAISQDYASEESDDSLIACSACDAEKYVFLSYSHGNQDTVMRIRQYFKEADIPIWIDSEQMGENLLDSMSDGIENCVAILCCMSDFYKQSASCRMEAEYALKLGKPIIPLILQSKYKPTGWLGLILGNKKYYDFSGRKDFNTTFRQLEKYLGQIIYGKDTTDALPRDTDSEDL